MPTPIGPPTVAITATHASADQAIEWEPDSRINRVRVLFEGSAGKIAMIGTEGAAIADNNAITVPAGEIRELRLKAGRARLAGLKFYTSADVGGTVVRLLADRG